MKENPETSREFKKFYGEKCTAWDSSSTESKDLYSTDSPGNCATNVALIVRGGFIKWSQDAPALKAKPYSLKF